MEVGRTSVLRTWGRTHASRVAEILRPSDEEGVRAAVRRAGAEGRRLKAFGALHSWSDIALGGDLALSLDALSGVVAVDGRRVTVRGGTRLRDLNAMLDDRGLAMPILGSVNPQSIAGAISTGTHGSSLRHGNLATLVRGLRLVTGEGEVLELREGDARLDAARVGLGALGVITEVVLDVEPAFNLAEVTSTLPVERAIDQLAVLAASAEFVKVWWLPGTDRAVIFSAEKTSEPSRFSPVGRWFDERVVNQALFAGLLALGRRVPAVVAPVNRLVGATYFRPRRTVATSHRVFNLPMPPVHQESEYAVPMARAPEAFRSVVELVRASGWPVDFLVEVRFVKGDAAWMSPASGRDTCQIGAYAASPEVAGPYFAAFEERMLALEGRPHWGKQFGAPGEVVLPRYPRSGDFLALARALDPAGVFRNPFLARLGLS